MTGRPEPNFPERHAHPGALRRASGCHFRLQRPGPRHRSPGNVRVTTEHPLARGGHWYAAHCRKLQGHRSPRLHRCARGPVSHCPRTRLPVSDCEHLVSCLARVCACSGDAVAGHASGRNGAMQTSVRTPCTRSRDSVVLMQVQGALHSCSLDVFVCGPFGCPQLNGTVFLRHNTHQKGHKVVLISST